MKSRKILVEFHGDSTTFGSNPLRNYQPVRVPVPETVQQLLQTHHGMVSVDCLNFGIGGATAASMLAEQPSWQRRLDDSPAEVLVFNFGINDIWARPDALAGFGAMRRMVRAAVHIGKTVIVETPNPVAVGMGRLGLAPQAERLRLWCQALRALAWQHGCYLCDHHAQIPMLFPAWRKHTPDGIHPDAVLYRFKARMLAMTLFEALLREGLVKDEKRART